MPQKQGVWFSCRLRIVCSSLATGEVLSSERPVCLLVANSYEDAQSAAVDIGRRYESSHVTADGEEIICRFREVISLDLLPVLQEEGHQFDQLEIYTEFVYDDPADSQCDRMGGDAPPQTLAHEMPEEVLRRVYPEVGFDDPRNESIRPDDPKGTWMMSHDRPLRERVEDWIVFVGEVEAGYELNIYDYANDLGMRDTIEKRRSCVEADSEILRDLEQADNRFYAATRASSTDLRLPYAKEVGGPWWQRVPIILVGELRDDLLEEMIENRTDQ